MGKKAKTPDVSTYFTLFVKFSRRIPNPVKIEDEVRSLYSKVLNVRKPRQKSARWILVDFDSNENAEEFQNILREKKSISTLPVKVKKLNIKQNDLSKPDNERKEKLNSLAKLTFESKKLDQYSNKLLVQNLPESITMAELNEWFPNNQHIDLKHSPKRRAIVTYSSSREAMEVRIAVKPLILKEKIRVILLLLNSDSKQKPKERYFEKSKESPDSDLRVATNLE